MRDPRVPWPAKIIAAAVVAYVASPIDLIPDFIPGLGHVDDLLVALIGGALLLRSVPRHVVEEHLREYECLWGLPHRRATSQWRMATVPG
jgi:uncharacterized membrane protein YkvA (DUF1232 family)